MCIFLLFPSPVQGNVFWLHQEFLTTYVLRSFFFVTLKFPPVPSLEYSHECKYIQLDVLDTEQETNIIYSPAPFPAERILHNFHLRLSNPFDLHRHEIHCPKHFLHHRSRQKNCS